MANTSLTYEYEEEDCVYRRRERERECVCVVCVYGCVSARNCVSSKSSKSQKFVFGSLLTSCSRYHLPLKGAQAWWE